MSLESVLLNWREFATSKRWIAQLQKKNDDKTVPSKTLEDMSMWMPQFLRFHQKTPDELIEESISDSEMAGDRLDDFYRFKKETIDRNSCITGIYGTLRGFYRHNKVNVQDITAPKFSPIQAIKVCRPKNPDTFRKIFAGCRRGNPNGYHPPLFIQLKDGTYKAIRPLQLLLS